MMIFPPTVGAADTSPFISSVDIKQYTYVPGVSNAAQAPAAAAGDAASSAAASQAIDTAAQQAANVECAVVNIKCPCGFIEGNGGCVSSPAGPKANMHLCPCGQTMPGGKVWGECVAPLTCHAVGFSFLDSLGLGGSSGTIGQIIGSVAASQLMSLFSGSGSKGSNDTSGYGSNPYADIQSGCSSYYAVSVPSADPCAYYVPGGTGGVSSDLLGGLDTTTVSSDLVDASSGASDYLSQYTDTGSDASSVSDSLLGLPAEDATTTNGQPAVRVSAGAIGTTSVVSKLTGSIVYTKLGGTIVANSRDLDANTEVAGFYGGDTLSDTPKGFIGSLCQWRPWANSIISFVIPPSFFDGLCSWGGYRVGDSSATTTPSIARKRIVAKPTATTTPTGLHPEIVIWASPTHVALSGRTSIFWNSKDTASCVVTSSDGSFHETTLSGGASTVPITDATTFTATCTTLDGTTITDSTEVDLAI